MAKFFKSVFFFFAIVALVYGDVKVKAKVKVKDGEDEAKAKDAAPVDEEISVEVIGEVPADCERKTKRFDQLSIVYTGTITETGVEFDSSYDRSEPFKFQLGTGRENKGWDEGLTEMCVGEKRKLIIPASKAHGAPGAGENVPPNAGLTFEVELLDIEDGEVPQNIFKEIDTNGDKMISQDEVSAYLKARAKEFGDEDTSEEKHNEQLTEIFQQEDVDKDGFISHNEFSGPKHDEL